MKVPPDDFLRALLQDETVTAATIDMETTRGETRSGTGSGSVDAIVNVVVVVVLVVDVKFTPEDVEELMSACTRFGRCTVG